MLNRRGRERLAEIESALVTDDPKLAARFDQFDSGDSTEDVLPRVVLFALVGMLGVLSVATLVLANMVMVGVLLATLAVAVLLAGTFTGARDRP